MEKIWVAVITNEDGPSCVLGPFHIEEIAVERSNAFIEFMDRESIGGCISTVVPLVSFEEARDAEIAFNESIAGGDDE